MTNLPVINPPLADETFRPSCKIPRQARDDKAIGVKEDVLVILER